ncbi:GNAT family N-acetyltransferase [Microbacterium betulae]|uniref:GNAT family N-acetyltransferase n=1 Tax=Microbacterium betulae TaxID=2981139 RepID=A0AA97FH56_9MICO|nr:GNAT family N-acetyltransferase [Microbacterium sp. AB]WOF22429.1 GNAT family N-acetyltransferase [Microbacterium sp. AB]
MAGTGTTVRRATATDARGLAEVHIRAWRISYAGLIPQATLDRLDVSARTRAWERILASDRDPTWAAVAGHRVLGFASSGAARDAAPPARLELYSIYVDPDRHGAGVAEPLLDAAIGDRPAYLWVLAGNARAIRFYEKQGFDLDGGAKDETAADGTPMHELRMTRS